MRPLLQVVDVAQRLAAAVHQPEHRLADLGVFRGLAAAVMSSARRRAAGIVIVIVGHGRRIRLEFFRGKPRRSWCALQISENNVVEIGAGPIRHQQRDAAAGL